PAACAQSAHAACLAAAHRRFHALRTCFAAGRSVGARRQPAHTRWRPLLRRETPPAYVLCRPLLRRETPPAYVLCRPLLRRETPPAYVLCRPLLPREAPAGGRSLAVAPSARGANRRTFAGGPSFIARGQPAHVR